MTDRGTPSPLGAILELQDRDEENEGAYVPALSTVRAQQEALKKRLREGFNGRHDFLMWTHAVAAVSAGSVPNEWFSDAIGNRWLVACCLADEDDRERLCSRDVPQHIAESRREDLLHETVSPAMEKGLELLRSNSRDYTEDVGGIKQTDRQRFLGMRPRLHQIAVAQHRAILEALGHRNGGLNDRREVADWADYVVYACGGFTPDRFSARVTAPMGQWYSDLVSPGGSVVVEFLLAEEMLPAANQALRAAVREGEELAARRAPSNSDGGIS